MFTAIGELIVYPLSFAKKRTFAKDLFGIGLTGQYSHLSNFQTWASPHLLEAPDEVEGTVTTGLVGKEVTTNGFTFDFDVDLRFRMGKNFNKDIYSAFIFKLLPFNYYRSVFNAGTHNEKSLLKTVSWTFFSVGAEVELFATKIFNFRTYFHYPIFKYTTSSNWDDQTEGYQKANETFTRTIDYREAEASYYKLGALMGVGYAGFRFHLFFNMGNHKATVKDGLEANSGKPTESDPGEYTTHIEWLSAGGMLGAIF